MYKNLLISTETYEIVDYLETYDRQKGRDEYRQYTIYGVHETTQKWLDKNDWVGSQRIIHVHRFGTREHKPFEEKSLYILSRPIDDAQIVAPAVRGHWKIENDLHYKKDIIFKEDHISIKEPKAATVIGFLITIAFNLLKVNNITPSTHAFSFFSNKVNELSLILNKKFLSFRT